MFTHSQIIAMADYCSALQIETKGTTALQLFCLYYNNDGNISNIGIVTKGCSFEESDIQQGFSGKAYCMNPEEKQHEDAGFFRGFKIVPVSVAPTTETYLTNGGNLLRFHPEFNKWYFQKPNGEFIREVSGREGEFLSQQCLKVEIKGDLVHPEFLPIWIFIKSIQVTQDNSNYRWETCNNGGNYYFQVYHDWYVAQYPDGTWKFCYVETHYTSAEFSYDELQGRFQQDMGNLFLSNVQDGRCYYSQAGIEWVEGEKEYSSNETLEKVGEMSTFEQMWKEQFCYYPSKFEDDNYESEPEYSPALTISDKKEIVRMLKNLDVDLRQGYRRHKKIGLRKSNRR